MRRTEVRTVLEKLPDVIGHVLHAQRAGIDKVVFRRLPLRGGHGTIAVTSLAFADHAPIPERYTADGEGLSPPLQWQGVPRGAQSLVLIVEDADAPTPAPLVLAIAVNLGADECGSLAEGALERGSDADLDLGRNSALAAGWLPPDPPPGHGVHHYCFQLYALGAGPPFDGRPGRDAVVQVLTERALASGCLIGTYVRHDTRVKTDAAAVAAASTPDTA